MGNEEFGRFVQALRRRKTFFDDEGYLRQWTQEKLAEAAGLSVRQISSIEQGRVVNLNPYLEFLCVAFNLTEAERVDLYAKAGYIYQIKRPVSSAEHIRSLLEHLHHPASMRTPLWDFVAFNEYHRVLWGHTPESLDALNRGVLGANLLRVLFDPDLRNHKIFVRRENWLEKAVLSFRAMSFPYVDTQRYRQVLKEMMKYPEFERMWQFSERLSKDPSVPGIRRPVAKISHPEFGELEFMSLRVPQKYVGGGIDVSIYVPLASSEEKYRWFRERVRENVVYFFKEQPVE